VPRLYRSVRDLEHWFVCDDREGWMSFPAKIDGWAERRPVHTVCDLDVREVPLGLSFNTGLLETCGRRPTGMSV
jgi:hypothetical protein